MRHRGGAIIGYNVQTAVDVEHHLIVAHEVTSSGSERVSDLLCMSNLAHASKLKEHDDNDDIQGSIRRAAERR